MTVTREDDKPWKTDLARKAAQRREMVGQELEEVIKKAASFEEALHQAVEMMNPETPLPPKLGAAHPKSSPPSSPVVPPSSP